MAILVVSTMKKLELFAPEVSTPSIARTNDAFAVVPTRLTFEPVLNPAPPAAIKTLLMNPENTSETIASALVVAPPPEIKTGSPIL